MKIVSPGTTEEFARYYELRWQVLRAPWSQPHGSERDELEADAYHVMASEADYGAVAVGRLHRLAEGEAQIRYMAVAEHRRGMGLGSRILVALEQRALDMGLRRIVLDSRESAVGFYERHGYGIIGLGNTLFGSIRHFRMAKDL